MASTLLPHAKLDWTISKLNDTLTAEPENVDARLELARCTLSRGVFHGGGEAECNQALALARKVLQEDPMRIEAVVIAGWSLVGMDRSEAAGKYLVQAQAGGERRADLSLALGAMARLEGELGSAVRHLEGACRLAPEAWETHLWLGETLMELARTQGMPIRLVERAQYHLVRTMQLEPTPDQQGSVIEAVGMCCMITGRYREAERFFIRLRENPEHAPSARYHLGQVAYEMGKYNNAIQHFRQYLRDKPEDTEVLSRMAMAWFQLGEFSKAREACNQALLVDPEHLLARYALGCTLLEEGDPGEAVKVFRETLKDHPHHMPTYVELVRTRRNGSDAGWLVNALQTEVGAFDRLAPGGRVDARGVTRQRIATVLDELRDVGPSMLGPVLGTIDLAQDEALRFQLWESACSMVLGAVADAAASRLREPGKHFGPGLGLEALSASAVLPEPVLSGGLKLGEAELKKAAVDRHGPAEDVTEHRSNLEVERKRARTYQALLLLAIGVRRSSSGKALLTRWAEESDADLACAAWAGLAMSGEPVATAKLAALAASRGGGNTVDRLLSYVVPPASKPGPRKMGNGESSRCSTCARDVDEVDHMIAGSSVVICDRCMLRIGQHRHSLAAAEDAHCGLCSRTHFEARGLYALNGIHVCSRCLELSLGQLEREEVDRFLAAW